MTVRLIFWVLGSISLVSCAPTTSNAPLSSDSGHISIVDGNEEESNSGIRKGYAKNGRFVNGFVTTNPYSNNFGYFPPCRIFSQDSFFQNGKVFKTPIQRSDIEKIHVRSKLCNESKEKYPPEFRNGKPYYTSVKYNLKKSTIAKIFPANKFPKLNNLCIEIRGNYRKGKLEGPATLYVETGENSSKNRCLGYPTSDKFVRQLFRADIKRKIGSHTGWQIYAIDGNIFVDPNVYANRKTKSIKYNDLFAIKLDLKTKDTESLTKEKLTRMLTADSASADILLKYSAKPNSTQLLDARAYKITVAVKIQFETKTRIVGLSSTKNSEVVQRDVDFVLKKENQYSDKGEMRIGGLTTAISGNILGSDVESNVTDARSVVYIKKIEPLQ